MASRKADEAKKISTNERHFRKLKNGDTKTDNNGHKVQFAEAYEEIYIEPNYIIKEESSPFYQGKNSPTSNGQCLKSCLKKTMKESKVNENRNPSFNYPKNEINVLGNKTNYPKITLSGSYPCLSTLETNLLCTTNGNYLSPNNVIPSIRRWSPSPVYLQEQVQASFQDTAAPFLRDNVPYFQEPRKLCYEDLNVEFYKESKPTSYQESGIQCNTDVQKEADENLLSLITSIKEDIQELKKKYETDDEIERNRFLTKELDEILQMYKLNMCMERETDVISDIGSTSSYQSVSIFKQCFHGVGRFLSQLCDDTQEEYLPPRRHYHSRSPRRRRHLDQ